MVNWYDCGGRGMVSWIGGSMNGKGERRMGEVEK